MTKAPEFAACPYCDGTEFIEAEQRGECHAFRIGHIFKSSALIHVICKNCGSVIHTRVKSVESMLTKAEKEERK